MAKSMNYVLVLYVYRLKDEGLELVTGIKMIKALLVEVEACIYFNERIKHSGKSQ